ncbi:aromatic-ring-hydroxylating dioxygenase subunit beta [Nitriliruptor alkaliphilus]|uniref:aromatic-ring-hydroxylating dioxygenase subunit beta n=1 Tax=Nitriliruptor alkaliphilus TaxID=427918 RepID=UPI000695DEB5|nr:aromatic-ring-hydroxylating dioxygenase subunit beta [Nitriliruptor alkaliphilus]
MSTQLDHVRPPVDHQGITDEDLATVDRDTHHRVVDFLHLEVQLLDDRRYNDWVTLFTDDARYVMPLRVTREAQAEWELSPTGRIFDDNRETLGIRIARLNTEYAWAEQPPSRTRHHVSNVRVQPTDTEGEYHVRSNLLVYRSRGDKTTYDLFSAARQDILREGERTLTIARRHVVLDQSAISAHNISIFF